MQLVVSGAPRPSAQESFSFLAAADFARLPESTQAEDRVASIKPNTSGPLSVHMIPSSSGQEEAYENPYKYSLVLSRSPYEPVPKQVEACILQLKLPSYHEWRILMCLI